MERFRGESEIVDTSNERGSEGTTQCKESKDIINTYDYALIKTRV